MFARFRFWLWSVLPVSAILGTAIVAWNLAWLPDPASADRAGLIRWLVFVEIPERDREVQLQLLENLQTTFAGNDQPLGVEETGLSERLEQRLQRNLVHLQQLWFYTRCEQACQLAGENREAFLDRQIQFAERWGELTPSDEGPDVFDRIDEWIAAAEGEKKRIAQDGVRFALHRFLQTRDLHQYPDEMHLELANRIVEDLEDGAELESVAGVEPSATQAEAGESDPQASQEAARLQANALLLIRAWLTDQSQHYAQLPPEQQREYLGRRLTQIQEWNVVGMMGQGDPADRLKTMLQFSQTVQSWIEEADDGERPAMEKLFRDITQRLMFGS